MPTAATRKWCRACGVGLESQSAFCTRCGVPLDGPEAGPPRIGRVVAVKGRLGHRNGVALRESGTVVEVLLKGDAPVEVPIGEFDGLGQVEVPGPPVLGAAGRLWKVLQAGGARNASGKWAPEAVHAAASAHATVSLRSRRAAAVDAITLGLPQMAGRLGLADSEVRWYLARAAGAAGDTAAAVGHLERLPARAYHSQVVLLLSRAGDLLGDQALGARAAALLEPFADEMPDARALRAALAPVPAADVLDLLVPLAAAAEGPGGPLAAIASQIVGLAGEASAAPPELRTVRALQAYLRGRAGGRLGEEPEALGLLPTPLVDELIDLGAIAPGMAGRVAWRSADAAYLRCRLDPAGASDEDVERAGFAAESARRRFLAGARPGALADLPDADPGVRHYRALARWRESSGAEDLDGVRPPARQLLTMVGALRAGVAGGEEAVVPAEVAADPSCWPLLRECAMTGALRLPDHLREKYPGFGDWLDLCGLQRLAFGGSWPQLAAGGRDLARRAVTEAVSVEALNMTAFAEFQQGRTAEALQALDEALAGRYTTGLTVNASVVAASRGSGAAFGYLARIVSLEPDPAVREGAVQRAVDLWLADEASPDYPDALRALVRQALAGELSDDVHRRLVRLADAHDAGWLAAGITGDASDPIRAANPAQAEVARYYRTWARARTPGYPEGLAEVARTLARVVSGPQAPDWAQGELRRFVKDVDEAIHCTFGEAVHLAPPIEALLEAGVLDPVEELVLAAQAGAHICYYLAEHDGCVAPDVERRLIFDTVAKFQARKAGLPEAGRRLAGAEVARCVSAAANAMGMVTASRWKRRSPEWDALVRRERHEVANRPEILRLERALLADLESYVTRLRSYLVCMKDLPLSEAAREVRAELSQAVVDWTAEINRLRALV